MVYGALPPLLQQADKLRGGTCCRGSSRKPYVTIYAHQMVRVQVARYLRVHLYHATYVGDICRRRSCTPPALEIASRALAVDCRDFPYEKQTYFYICLASTPSNKGRYPPRVPPLSRRTNP